MVAYKAISDSLENCKIINCNVSGSIELNNIIFIINKPWMGSCMRENINKTIKFVPKNTTFYFDSV